VRRIVLILLVLVLTPSMAAATMYRCAYDGSIRAACCCPSESGPHKQAPPPRDPALRAACCCTIIQAAGRPADLAVRASAPSAPAQVAVVAPPIVMLSRWTAVTAIALDRPRAQGDPPDTLFARRCSLLL
jgi:hypothetical protein